MRKLFTLLTLLLGVCSGAWADETIFSMSSVTNGKTSVAKGATQSITATFNAGSSAEVYNGHGTDAKEMISSGGQIQLGGSGSSYFHATFTSALAEGDVITSNTESDFYVNGTSSKPEEKVTFPYTIKSTDTGLIGKTDLYVWKGSNGKNFTSFTITRITGIHAPSITQSGASVTLECSTGGVTIYYTTDGSEPTTSSATYSTAITLPNSCTVRAFAKKGDEVSDLAKKDCYVSHASVDGYITALGYNGGTVNGDVWTGTDFTITNNVENRGINYVNLAGTQDGFKLNHTDSYTIQPSEDVKVTKIVVVGKTWLHGDADNASTIAFDGFTPASGAFYEYLTDGETYVKTIEFTPSAEQSYGQSITMRPSNNQLGAYIEVYGVKRNVPVAPTVIGAATWDFTSSSVGTVTANSSNTLTATTGSGTMTYVASSSCSRDNTSGIKGGGATQGSTPNWTSRYFVMQIASNGELSITTNGNEGEFIILQGSTNSVSAATQKATITTSTAGTAVSEDLSLSDGAYVFIGFPGGKRYTKSITWTPSVEGITLTTSANMAGWRAFYDADNGYTVDANTEIYIVSAKDETKATLTKVTGRIPKKTPVLLKTSAANRTMTLTKATSGTDIDATENKLTVTDGTAVSNAYRLGYGAEDVGFYPYSATSPASGIVYLSSASQTPAKALTFVFIDPTGISSVSAKKAVSTGKRFNLSGQLVGEDYKGIVIENGKKYIK